MLSRRGLLVGGGAALAAAEAVGIEQGALPGRSWIRSNLALDAHAPEPPSARPGRRHVVLAPTTRRTGAGCCPPS